MHPAALIVAAALALAASYDAAHAAAAPEPQPGIAMHGEPKYGPGFAHFDYANPDAPRGGTIKLAAQGTYDSFNPYIIRGVSASGMSMVFETLMTQSEDEPFSLYGLVAQSVTVPEDRSWATFTLNPEARWHDGEPITVEDVIFSLQVLKKEGHPFYRYYYQNVANARKVGERQVRFDFSGGVNRELPLIVGQMPILPKHYWEGRSFGETTLEPPLGSGPYRIADFEPGRYVVFERVDDYWAEDLPVNAGRWNFERVRFDYYRDATVVREALKAGNIDLRQENQAKAWARAYDVPAVRQGRLNLEEIDHDIPTGMQGFAMNTRREVFADRRVRRAMAYAFDFEWTNDKLFFGQYERTESYFSNSELASRGLPEGRELEILERFRGRVPEEVFTRPYDAPSTGGSGYPRANLKKALELLNEAGWVVRDMKLVNRETGRPMRFEILLVQEGFERIVLPYVHNLNRLGIEVDVRLVDSAQYQNRLDNYDFDMIVNSWGQSPSPGNEQRSFWGSEAGKRPGSRNYAGVDDPVVDELIEMLIAAPDRRELVARTRALDRVLLWGHYVVPNWHIGYFRVVYWDKFSRPKTNPPYGLPFLDTWWFKSSKAVVLDQGGGDQPAAEGGGLGREALTAAVAVGLMALALFFFRRQRGGGGRPAE